MVGETGWQTDGMADGGQLIIDDKQLEQTKEWTGRLTIEIQTQLTNR